MLFRSPAYTLTVTHVTHYTPTYFRFRIERPEEFQFKAGQFVMIGLPGDDGQPIMRAYSICSPIWDDELEFYSIIMQDGALTSRLQHIQVGDTVLMAEKAVGTLTLEHIREPSPEEAAQGRRLYMLSTGTGIAPFMSLIRDEDTYDAFDDVILTHTCRQVQDLQYGIDRVKAAHECPLVGEEASEKLRLYSCATREDAPYTGRITTLIESGKLFTDLGVPPLNPATDRVMICGSLEMLRDLQALMAAKGLSAGTKRVHGEYVWEKAFAG